ncbi:uncharacterized protein A1O9_02994 [Exophiala aquamarina CBS 119918]|uniref:Uncharacterized protein n=1 Tax=Exophiala aquamarina CBS 119918 TaxID=1182545 RepID=A0A072PQ06_9EURO|nr:uncharacterized protein A1O9_02994 [Exophiala aquamarina CBS 119918]KEF61428.1 hypothetical protein A1O9_02994 [Exophiala aquamarina CBS 119918]
MLGKRKREFAVAPRQTSLATTQGGQEDGGGSSVQDHDVFRRYFEAAFEPLPAVENGVSQGEAKLEERSLQASDEESDWDGLSEAGEEKLEVEIVEHGTTAVPRDHDDDDPDSVERQRLQYRHFMTSKPPSRNEQTRNGIIPGKRAEKEADDESEAQNLKHDLDLQRLLKESHLLEQAKASTVVGSHRHKAVDMRMQSLGSKDSLFTQERMPLSHRRGIAAKAASRQALRRREAKENGIILERAGGSSTSTGKSKSNGIRRERAVDVPAVGRFRGGTLKLSKHDVLDIQGSGQSGKKGRKKTGRRR